MTSNVGSSAIYELAGNDPEAARKEAMEAFARGFSAGVPSIAIDGKLSSSILWARNSSEGLVGMLFEERREVARGTSNPGWS